MLRKIIQRFKRAGEAELKRRDRSFEVESNPIYAIVTLLVACGAVFALHCEARNSQGNEPQQISLEEERLKSEKVFKIINSLSPSEIHAMKFIIGEDRLEEGFGKYTERNLKSSHCVYVTENKKLIFQIFEILKGPGSNYRTPPSGYGWEPREGVYFDLNDGKNMSVLFDGDARWGMHLPGAIDEAQFFLDSSLNRKLLDWASEVNKNPRCQHLFNRYLL